MRRVRVKAIANVAVRRKVEQKLEENTPKPAEPLVKDEPKPEELPKPPEVVETIDNQPSTEEYSQIELPSSPKKPIDIKIISVSNVSHASVPPSPTLELGIVYPRPPASPHKILNRPRIRSTPRLGHRRTSTSASESEDDSRRTFIGRVRNDSVSSVSATTQLVSEECSNNIENNAQNVSTSASSPPKKKMRRSEIAKKMAEAKKEFQYRFGSKTPERHKLTMMDLIFYNPTANPMTEEPKKTESKSEEDLETESSKDETNETMEEQEEAMPVPQVKIGENGELILDEQSLIIETSDTLKSRELTSTAINYDDLDTGYGVYKRTKRTKDWSNAETKLFYRVLQMIGTDFSLMLGYFKNRTRRDLKIKFKKEERMNRGLIDKVLMHPKTFDLDELQKTLERDNEVEKLREEERRKNKVEKEKKLEEKRRNRLEKKPKRKVHASFFARQMYSSVEEMSEELDLKESSTYVKDSVDPPEVVYQRPRRGLRKKYNIIESDSESVDDPDSLQTDVDTKLAVIKNVTDKFYKKKVVSEAANNNNPVVTS